MATTRVGAALTTRHRAQQLAIRARLARDLQRVWRVVDPTNLRDTVGTFVDVAPGLVVARHRASAITSARYVTAFRGAERVAGAFTPTIPQPPAQPIVGGVVRGAGLAGIVAARRGGFSPQAAAHSGFVRMLGSAAGMALAGGRGVLAETVTRDRRAIGWMRVASGDACAWCAMQASRGPVFSSEDAAENAGFHDHDACTIEPVYDENTALPATSQQHRDRWDEVTQGLGGDEARQAFRQALDRTP